MVNFLNLPTVEAPRNALMDFAPINNAIDGNRRNALAQLESKRQDEQLAMQRDNQQYQRGRDQKNDAWQQVQRAGQMADAIQRMPDSPAKQSAWGNYLKSYGDGNHSPEELDYRTGPAIAAAAAGKWRDPREDQMADLEMQQKRAQIGLIGAQTAAANQRGDGSFNQRAQAAQAYGLDTNSDAGKAYILTGKLPREDQQSLTATDKKAIFDADETVMNTEAAISSLNRALDLSGKAYDGATANERAWLTSQFGSQAGIATRELNQAITETALQQLKAIFGAAPTEGERKILLDIQGSAELPQQARESIIRKAIGLAERRLEFNKDRSNQLRGGTFYKPQSESGAQPAPSGLGGSPVRARNANGDVIEFNGTEWVPVQ